MLRIRSLWETREEIREREGTREQDQELCSRIILLEIHNIRPIRYTTY